MKRQITSNHSSVMAANKYQSNNYPNSQQQHQYSNFSTHIPTSQQRAGSGRESYGVKSQSVSKTRKQIARSPHSTSPPKTINSHSYSPQRSTLQREMSPGYTLARPLTTGGMNHAQLLQQYSSNNSSSKNNGRGSVTSKHTNQYVQKITKIKNKQQKQNNHNYQLQISEKQQLQTFANMSRLSMNSFANKRLSMPKNVSQPLSKIQGEQSLNQSVGDESFYSGEGYISKSVVQTANYQQMKKSKSPKSTGASSQQRKRHIQHHYATSSNTPAHAKNYSSSGTTGSQIGANKKRNSQIIQNSNAAASNQGAPDQLSNGGGGNNQNYQNGVKQINNYIIDPSSINTHSLINSSKAKGYSSSTKSSTGAHVQHLTNGGLGGGASLTGNNKILAVSGINQNLTHIKTTKQAVSAQNKVNQSFHSGGLNASSAYIQGNQPLSSSFAERRLSAKVIENHKKGHHGHSKSGSGIVNSQYHHQQPHAIQYENLMLQQLLKQQQLKDQQAQQHQQAVANFNKNVASVIQIDQVAPVTTNSGQPVAPHMMLNISYNMNNNINHTSATDQGAQFLFQQDPSQLKNLLGGFTHSATTDEQQQLLQQRTLIEQARVFKTQIDKQMQHKMGQNSNGSGGLQANGGTMGAMSAASSMTNMGLGGGLNGSPPQIYQQTNSGQIMNHSNILDAQQNINYENSMINAVKGAERKFRDNSFDQAKHSKKKAIATSKRSKQVAQTPQSTSQPITVAIGRQYLFLATPLAICPKIMLVQLCVSLLEYSVAVSNRITNQKISFKKVRNSMIDKTNEEALSQGMNTNGYDKSTSKHQLSQAQQQQNAQKEEDKILLQRLDDALTRDLQDKSTSQRVSICSKVWSELIRREADPIISSLLTKIKQSYETHIKSQSKVMAQQQKEIDFEQELKRERQERKEAEGKIDHLSVELKRQQQCMEKQEFVIQDMKKQILAYRQEIIQLSTSKKYQGKNQNASKKGQARDAAARGSSDMENMRVPRLDLSKVKRDSEEDEEDDDEDNQNSGKVKKGVGSGLEGSQQQNVTYQQYLKFLENESRFDEMGEESQESIMRQEELKQRKNKIIQLLNGEISEEDNADHIEQSSGEEGAGDGDEQEQYRDEDDLEDYNEADYIHEMDINAQSINDQGEISNPPSTVKKLNYQQQEDINDQNSSEIDILGSQDMDMDVDMLSGHQLHQHLNMQKQMHQLNKNDNAGLQQEKAALKQQIRDFKDQISGAQKGSKQSNQL